LNKYLLCFLALFIAFIFPVFSQEENITEEIELEEEDIMEILEIYTDFISSYPSDAVFVISSFEFNIKGLTRSDALLRKGEIYAGEKITGTQALVFYVREKRQKLYNERVLESVEMDFTVGEINADGTYPVKLIITTKDTWNIIALPRPEYSTSTGWDITIKARDYNFLGTMSPLRIDLGYQYNEKRQTYFLLMLDTQIPFRLFNLEWEIDFDHYFNYRPDMEEPYYYKNITGLSFDLPVAKTTFNFGFSESVILNEQNSDKNILLYGYGNFQKGVYFSSNPYVSWKIPTGLELDYWGELTYKPNISAKFNHELPQWPLDEIRKGPFLSFGHRFDIGRIDWIDNFKKGFEIGLSNSYSYNIFRENNDMQPWDIDLKLNAIGHLSFGDMFGISSRIIYRQYFFDNYDDSAGDVLRGVIDKDINAEIMFAFNFDFSINFLKFRPSEWFNNNKMRILNFDLHVVPFLDTAIYRYQENERIYKDADFTFKNMLVSCGLEAIIFPEFFRSLFLRVSLGINLSTMTNIGQYELFLGTEFHY
jgi:hypothetical protein